MDKDEARTSTAEALLGVLSLRSMSGYQIRLQIEESIGNFWRESYGQIYPTLKRLLGEGLVRMESAGGGRAESKVYSLTEAGRERLVEWIGTPSTRQVPRNEVLLKLFFGGLVAIEVVREQIGAFRRLHEGELRRLTEMEEDLTRRRGRDARLPFWLMTLRYGVAESRAMVAWADEVLVTCEELERTRSEAELAIAPVDPRCRVRMPKTC